MRATEHTYDVVFCTMARGWPGLRQERLGDWVARLGDGYTSRANSVVAAGDPGVPAADAVDWAAAVYGRAGLAPCFQLPVPWDGAGGCLSSGHQASLGGPEVTGTWAGAAEEVDSLLEDRGYVVATPSRVDVIDAADCVPPAVTGVDDGLTTSWSDAPDATWLALVGDRFRQQADTALAVTTAHPARYVSVSRAGEPVARGRVSWFGDWFGLSDLLVVEAFRGRGLGRHLTALMMAEGARRGSYGVLQVEADNVRAQTLYTSLGWQPVGGYHYRRRP